MNPIGIVILLFVGVLVVVAIVRAMGGKGRKTIDRRMEDVVGGGGGFDAGISAELDARMIAGKRSERFQIISDLLKGRTFFKKIDLALIAAGIPLKPVEFLGLVVLSTLVMTIIGIFVGKKVLMTVLFTLIGFKLPFMVLNFLRGRRIRIFESQLSDSLTMIASGLKAGYGFLQGINAAAEQMPPPISEEFRRVVRSAQLGMEMRDALERMGQRVQSYDLDMAITACCVQLQTGGNLSELLETISQTIRARIKLRREISAATAQGRMSGAILVLLPVGIGVALNFINRDYASLLFTTDLGKSMIKVALGMQFTGCWIINKMLQFDG
ncbi:MAG: type II secretion system F family protein [Armatimonadetes bacterium]|nr:type II secretion system F family protein [Armatimonadota bacterium]